MMIKVSKNIDPSTTENMTDVNVDFQHEKSASGQNAPGDRLQEDVGVEVDDVALAPPGADHGGYSCLDIKGMEMSLQSMQLQLQFFMHKADDLHSCLVNGQGHVERDALAAAVVSFLYTCQPYFNHLESTVRSTRPQHTSLGLHIYTQLLDIYQQLCDKLEQLVLSCASHNLLCLEETEPNSVSHFCVGQCQLGQLKVTTFLYCKPTPYLSQVDTRLYKRMRWNVEKLQVGQKTDKEQGGESKEREEKTEYYFLCYEDIPNTHAETDWGRPGFSDGNVVRMWSIGQWVQVDPDPITENIDDWILCDVPQANYNKLLFLGIEEPSCCIATDYMQQLLLSWKSADSW